MPTSIPQDKSNGYEEYAEAFMAARNPCLGPAIIREWMLTLPHGCAILDLGCGHGVPISEALIAEGFEVYGVDASATMIEAFLRRFPEAHAQCASVEDSDFFRRTFDGVVASGLMFLLPVGIQALLIHKVAAVLNPTGRFLFTSPQESCTWYDALTGRDSISLGSHVYGQILNAQGFRVIGERFDEGHNHYFFTLKS
jgi:2-polyprenyl-3-methyl-5-hydroxy-6-metoxy-1,4-benzoquinol methylase